MNRLEDDEWKEQYCQCCMAYKEDEDYMKTHANGCPDAKTYEVGFEGWVRVKASSKDEALDLAYDAVQLGQGIIKLNCDYALEA